MLLHEYMQCMCVLNYEQTGYVVLEREEIKINIDRQMPTMTSSKSILMTEHWLVIIYPNPGKKSVQGQQQEATPKYMLYIIVKLLKLPINT